MERQKKYLIKIAYHGNSFAGWQTQSNALGIQTLIESKLEILLRHPTALVGSGRTDSGVHALGQMAHFETDSSLPPTKIQLSLNALLPDSVRILSIQEVPLEFHARFDVLEKTYVYHIYNACVMDPFHLETAWHIPYPLCIEKMEEAMRSLVGRRDFKAFAAKNDQGAAAVCSIRDLKRFILKKDGALLSFELTADGFLYKMVRNLIGCIVEVGSGKRSLDVIVQGLEQGARQLIGATAPAHGLFLSTVRYPELKNPV